MRLEPVDPLVDQPDLLLCGLRLVALAILHERADRLGRVIALRLKRFDLTDQLAPLFVE